MMEGPEAGCGDGAVRYPPYVTTPEEERRWELAEGIARLLFEDDGDPASVWMAARAIFQMSVPT